MNAFMSDIDVGYRLEVKAGNQGECKLRGPKGGKGRRAVSNANTFSPRRLCISERLVPGNLSRIAGSVRSGFHDL